MDGWITIGTKLDTTKFDQEVSNLENKIDSAEKKQDLINQKTSQYQNELKRVSAEVDQLSQEYEKAAQKAERLNNIVKTQGQKSYAGFQANLEYQEQVKLVDQLYGKLSKAEQKQQSLTNKVSQSNLQYENSVKQVNALRGKLQQLNVKQAQSQFGSINTSIKNVGKNLNDSIRQVGRLALGIFSIASAYRLVSSMSGTLAQYDKQYAANIEYIQFALAQGLAPVLKFLVNLAGTLLSYLNYILSAWFGINIFSGATADKFASMANSASSAAKSAKEIKKQLAGFDEMNVLSSNDTSTGGAGTGGVSTPSFDVSGIQGEVPSWLKWIADNKDIVIAGLAGIAAGLIALKLGLGGLMSLGIGIAVAGIVLLVQDILKFIENPTWDNFLNILRDIAIVVAGIAVAIGAWPVLIGAVIALIVVEIIKHWDQIKEILGKVGQWIWDNVVQPVWNFIQKLIDWLIATFKSTMSTIQGIFTAIGLILIAPFQTAWEFIQNMFNSVKTIIQGIGNVFKGIFTGDMTTALNGFKQIFKGVFDSLWSIVKAPLNLIIRGINSLISGANRISFDVPDWVPGFGGKKWGFNIPKIPLLASGGIINYPNRRSNVR